MIRRPFTGNALKLIACALMLFDHACLLFFPHNLMLRIPGRLGFPLFAFMIAEGAKYTKHKLRHLLTILALGTVCQIAYDLTAGDSIYIGILLSFSLSILLIYILQKCKLALFSCQAHGLIKLLWCALFAGGVAAAWEINRVVSVDYGFWGCIMPVFAALLDFRGCNAPPTLSKLDTPTARALCLLPPMIAFIIHKNTWLQPFSLLSLPLLLLYSGKRGSSKLKYFFYIFYPLHLAVLYGLYMLLR